MLIEAREVNRVYLESFRKLTPVGFYVKFNRMTLFNIGNIFLAKCRVSVVVRTIRLRVEATS